jgi:hypothetical protein
VSARSSGEWGAARDGRRSRASPARGWNRVAFPRLPVPGVELVDMEPQLLVHRKLVAIEDGGGFSVDRPMGTSIKISEASRPLAPPSPIQNSRF